MSCPILNLPGCCLHPIHLPDECRRKRVYACLSPACFRSAASIPRNAKNIEAQCAAAGKGVQDVLEGASSTLSGLTHHAGLVLAPKSEAAMKHIEFVSLAPGRALVVMVSESGVVENRVIEVPEGLPPSALIGAGNFLSAKLGGQTLSEAKDHILADLDHRRAQLDALTAKLGRRRTCHMVGRSKRRRVPHHPWAGQSFE